MNDMKDIVAHFDTEVSCCIFNIQLNEITKIFSKETLSTMQMINTVGGSSEFKLNNCAGNFRNCGNCWFCINIRRKPQNL